MSTLFELSATNPCHLYDLARHLNLRRQLHAYYSGYPRWKLRDSEGMQVQSFSARTLVVYGLLKTIPERYRISNQTLFRWQDENFDRTVAREIKSECYFVAIPGQALESFRRVKSLGGTTILSHATGPLERWIPLVQEEFERAGVSFVKYSPMSPRTLARHQREYLLADYHWVPSQVVRSQLISVGISESQIRVIPFGADASIFTPKSGEIPREKILFAGQLTWRKGLRLLERVIPRLSSTAKIQFAGPFLEESRGWVQQMKLDPRVTFLGALSAERLARVMRASSILILPSVEESFGLVVPQALCSGTPCLVSDRVGGQDLIEPGVNGQVIPWDDDDAWVESIDEWSVKPRPVGEGFDWARTAELFLKTNFRV